MKNSYFAKDKDGEIYENTVWPGTAVFPNFLNEKVRKWWGDLQKGKFDREIRSIYLCEILTKKI